MSIDPRAFRDAMGCFATAVTVVTTTSAEGRPVGVTVNSFNSVSLEPPLVLFSLGRDSTNLQAFLDAGRFAVNVLRQDQQRLSQGFANDGMSFFCSVDHEISRLGNPLLADAVASFDCRLDARHDGGDHLIFIGRVHGLRHSDGAAPLLYYRGRYASLDARI